MQFLQPETRPSVLHMSVCVALKVSNNNYEGTGLGSPDPFRKSRNFVILI